MTNREIKFRFYNSLGNEEMLFRTLLELTHEANAHLYMRNNYAMQYTGLKDKNNKDIYEGDIISYKYRRGFSGLEKEIIAKVEFVKGCFGFYEYKNEDDSYFNKDDLENCVVIGNIYENRELLKDE